MFVDVRPYVTCRCNPRPEVPKRERSRLDIATANLVPRAGCGYRRTSLRPNRIHRRKGRAVAVTACVDQNAAAPIDLAERLCQTPRVSITSMLADL